MVAARLKVRGLLVVTALLASLTAVPGAAEARAPESAGGREPCTIRERVLPVVVGTEDADVICVGHQGALVLALGGDDIVVSGSGNDVVVGGAGDDRIAAGSGLDIIAGDQGDDTCAQASLVVCETVLAWNEPAPGERVVDVTDGIRSAMTDTEGGWHLAYQGAADIRVGDVVVASTSPHTPAGLLARVVSVEDEYPEIAVETEPVALADVVPFGRFDAAFDLAGPGPVALAAAADTEGGHRVACSGDRHAYLDAYMTVGASAEADAVWSPWTSIDLLVAADAVADASAELVYEIEGECEGKLEVEGPEFPPLRVMIGPVPLILTTEIDLELSFSASASAVVSLTGTANASARAEAGLHHGEPFTDFDATFEADASHEISEDAALRIDLLPEIEVSAYGRLSAELGIGAFLEGTWRTQDTRLCYLLEVGMHAEAEIEVDVWLIDESFTPVDEELFRRVLAESDPPCGLLITTPLIATQCVGDAVDESLQARGGPAPYEWSLVGGSLPAGLRFADDGDTAKISGVARRAAASTIEVQVSDATGAQDRRSFTMRVEDCDGPPGGEIVFTDQSGRILVMDPVTFATRPVTPPVGVGSSYVDPAWVAGHRWIAALRATDLGSVLVLISRDGSEVREVTAPNRAHAPVGFEHTGEVLFRETTGFEQPIRLLAARPDGSVRIAHSGGRSHWLCDVPLATHPSTDQIAYVCAIPGPGSLGGFTVATGSILDDRFGSWQGFQHVVYGLDISPDGRCIVASDQGGLYMLEGRIGQYTCANTHFTPTGSPFYYRGVSFSPDGRHVVVQSNGSLEILSAVTGEGTPTGVIGANPDW